MRIARFDGPVLHPWLRKIEPLLLWLEDVVEFIRTKHGVIVPVVPVKQEEKE